MDGIASEVPPVSGTTRELGPVGFQPGWRV